MPERKQVTRKDVAERAGVSVAVVSYVVNDGPRPVSPETQAKVRQAIEELGYYDPSVQETDARTVLNAERIDYWLSVGAQPSEKVKVLIKKYGSNGTHLEQQKQALERLKATRPTPPPPMVVPRPQKPAAAVAEEAAPAPEATAEATETAEPSTGEAGGE